MSDPSPSSEPALATGGLLVLRCPVCGAAASDGDHFCEVDGTPLVREPDRPKPPSPLRCACESPQDAGDDFCSHCGLRIAIAPDHSEHAPSATLAGVTDRGVRHWRNEDAVVVQPVGDDEPSSLVLVVCDGVSTSQHPDQAALVGARVAADAMATLARQQGEAALSDGMTDAVRQAHRAVCALPWSSDLDLDPPSATIVAALVKDGAVTLAWLGDSRAYWITLDEARLLTHDHSWINDVVDSGQMSEAEARQSPNAHAITHCLGLAEDEADGAQLQPSVVRYTLPPAARLIVCSDGLWNYAPVAADLAALVRHSPPGEEALVIARRLVTFALSQGGHDNVTVAVVCLP